MCVSGRRVNTRFTNNLYFKDRTGALDSSRLVSTSAFMDGNYFKPTNNLSPRNQDECVAMNHHPESPRQRLAEEMFNEVGQRRGRGNNNINNINNNSSDIGKLPQALPKLSTESSLLGYPHHLNHLPMRGRTLSPSRCRIKKSYSGNGSGQSLERKFGAVHAVKTAQRSSARTVKDLIAKVDTICHDEQRRRLHDGELQTSSPPPKEELSTLANWSKDAYYMVVMTKSCAIPTTIVAMKTFPEYPKFQAICCDVISNLSCPIKHKRRQVQPKSTPGTAGGCGATVTPAQLAYIAQKLNAIREIVNTMNIHPLSEAVQSSAREALQNIMDCLIQQQEQLEADRKSITDAAVKTDVMELIDMLHDGTKDNHLIPSLSRELIERLLNHLKSNRWTE